MGAARPTPPQFGEQLQSTQAQPASASWSELAESLKGGNGKVGQAARNLAKKVNAAVKRKKQNDLLTALNEDFKEAKCQCQEHKRNFCADGRSGTG